MNIQVTNTRQLTKEEMKFLHKHVTELWLERANSAVRVSGAYVKAGVWMAANGFTKLINKATNENVTDKFDKATKVGTAFAIGAIIAMPILPVLPLAAAVASAGTYMIGALGQALHNVTEKDLDRLQAKAEKALEDAENLDETEYNARNKEYQDWKGYLDDEREIRTEQMVEKFNNFTQNVKNDWIEFKQDVKDELKDMKSDMKDSWMITKYEIKKRANAIASKVKNGVEAGFDKVKDGVKTATGAVKQFGENVVESVGHEVSEVVNYNKAKRERNKKAQEEARAYYIAQKEREAEINAAKKAVAKKQKQDERSKKCLNFLTTTTMMFGKIAEHCLTADDYKKYQKGLEVSKQISQAKEAERERRVKSMLDTINSMYGHEYTIEDYNNMSDIQRGEIENEYNKLMKNTQVAGATQTL